MPVIAIINRKGDSGKSTLATHVASWLARSGHRTMLGDVDRQQSTVPWLRRRRAQLPDDDALVGWAIDPQRVLRPPQGVTHAVLDTPGGLHGFDLSRVLGHADVVLVPVGDGPFDQEAAADGLRELRQHPRVAAGRIQIGVLGMRIEAGAKAERRMRRWAESEGVSLIGCLPSSSAYPQCASRGLSLFDLPAQRVARQLAAWRSVTDWIEAQLQRDLRPTSRLQRPVDQWARRQASQPSVPMAGLGPVVGARSTLGGSSDAMPAPRQPSARPAPLLPPHPRRTPPSGQQRGAWPVWLAWLAWLRPSPRVSPGP